MSTQRIVSPVTSFATFCKLATAQSSARLRYFSCAHTLRQSSKRELYTTPSYRPHDLPESFPPPPRNSGIPDTSIAGPKPTLGNGQTSGLKHNSHWGVGSHLEEAASISVPETEAQKSKPVTPPTTPSSTSEPKPRRSKLRPRKAPMTITPAAVEHLHELLSAPNPKMIRVGTKNRGCSGMAYHLEYVENPSKLDEVVEQDGVKVLIESKALFTMIGSEMDWQEDKLQARFVFKNPNISKLLALPIDRASMLTYTLRGTMRVR
ncbi:MAG: hypothetical protein Q9160_004806 [Pyrenula sp. 1 TL-2023]